MFWLLLVLFLNYNCYVKSIDICITLYETNYSNYTLSKLIHFNINNIIAQQHVI